MGQEQSWSKEVDHSAELSSCHEESDSVQGEKIVSFQSELPLPLHQSMAAFIERCPNWDQYRLIQAALAGFLVQNGSLVFTSAICSAVILSAMGFEFGSLPSIEGRYREG